MCFAMVSTAADYASGPRHPQLCSLPVLVGVSPLPYRCVMAGAVRSLEQLSAQGADLIVRCRACGHERTVPIEQTLAIFRRRGWPTDRERVADRFRCRTCGAKQVDLGATFYAHALRDQQVRGRPALAAVPEQVRTGLRPPPPGVKIAEWNRASEAQRKKMVERARS